MMSRVSAKDTRPEMIVRSLLHRMGYRFRLHDAKLPGRPDVVLKRHGVVVFVHGCFWHRHSGCKKATVPARNREFWLQKFGRNMQRDQKNYRLLRDQGWRILVIWECELNDASRLKQRVSDFIGVR
jgi:DNA mismatch endonuclease, patch repair protein